MWCSWVARQADWRGLPRCSVFIDAVTQFNRSLIAEGVADYHHQALTAVLPKLWLHPMIEEVLLAGYSGDPPVLQPLLGLYLVAPASAQLVEVPVGVTLLDGFIELLQQLYMSALGGRKIVAISPIKSDTARFHRPCRLLRYWQSGIQRHTADAG